MVPFNVDRFSPGRYDNEPSPTVPRKRRHSVSSRSSISESFRSQRNHVLDNRSHQPSPHPPNFSISQRSMGSQDDSLESQNISTGSQNTSSHSAKSHHSFVSRDSAGTRPSPMSQPSPPSHRSPTSYVSPPPEQHPSSEPLFSPLSPSPVDIPSPVEPNPPLVSSTFLPGPSIPKKPRHVAPTFVHDQEGQSHRATATPSLIASASGFGSFNQGSSGFGFGAYATQSQSLGNVSSQHSFLSSQPPPAPIEKNPEQEALDNKVGLYLRSIFTADPGWNEFVEARKQVLPVSGLLNQYRYVREKFLAYVGKHTPSELEGAPHVRITRVSLLRNFMNISMFLVCPFNTFRPKS